MKKINAKGMDPVISLSLMYFMSNVKHELIQILSVVILSRVTFAYTLHGKEFLLIKKKRL